ncbi:MAG: hypothetical protein ACHQQQ_09975 [Bacteroidota bacterium]
MKSIKLKYSVAGMGIALILMIIFNSIPAMSQDIVLDSVSTFHGTGTYNVKGNIDNSASNRSADTIKGRINLIGTVPESLGMPTRGKLVFDTLNSAGSSTKIMNVAIAVDSAIILSGAPGDTLSVNGHTLNIYGAAAKTGGVLHANGATDTVYYSGTSSQTILGAAYSRLLLTNNGTKNLQDTVVAKTLIHSGGALTVDKQLSVVDTAKIGKLANITSGTKLTLGTRSMIDTIAGNAGIINAGTDSTLIGRATNNGKIFGGSGTIAFNDTLTQNADTIHAGSGGIVFNSKPTIAASAALATASGLLNFRTDIQNNGIISVNGTSNAQFAGNFTATGSLIFDSTSTATYSGASGTQSIATATYGNLILSNSDKTTPDSLIAKGNLVLNKNLTMSSGKALILTSAVNRNVSGTGAVIGSVRRIDPFVKDSLYTFNSASVGLALDSTISGGNIQLTMLPDSDITNHPSTRYAKRHYTFSGSNLATAKIQSMSLTYADNELQGGVNPYKLGVRDYNGSLWSKVTNPAGKYVRTVDTTNHVVYVDSVSASVASVQEFALVNVAFGTRVPNSAWNLNATWDEGTPPSSTDDAEINHTGITATAGDSAYSVSLTDSSTSLTVSGGGLSVASTLDNLGTLNVGTISSAGTLNVASTLTNNKKVIVSPLGHLALKGRLKNYGDVTNDGVIDVGQ